MFYTFGSNAQNCIPFSGVSNYNFLVYNHHFFSKVFMNKKVLKLCHISAILAIADMVKLEFRFIAHSTISLKGLYHLQHTPYHITQSNISLGMNWMTQWKSLVRHLNLNSLLNWIAVEALCNMTQVVVWLLNDF